MGEHSCKIFYRLFQQVSPLTEPTKSCSTPMDKKHSHLRLHFPNIRTKIITVLLVMLIIIISDFQLLDPLSVLYVHY